MNFKATSLARLLILTVMCVMAAGNGAAQTARNLKFEALLVWATTAESSPDPKHKPVSDEVRQKLTELPLKWKNYFEVNRKCLELPARQSQNVVLSDKCKISVKDIDGKNVEVALVGKGEPILKRTQKLQKGEMLVLGGNAPDSTGWLVVLKRTE